MSPVRSFESKLQKNRKFTERIADDITRAAGSFRFFIINLVFFISWIVINSSLIPNVEIIDPYPFNFLTMIVSLEAIVLSIFVLISQNRQASIDSLREEIHLQINQIAEREITKSLHLIHEIHQKIVGKVADPELDRMFKKLDTGKIEAELEKQLEPPPMVISELFERAEKLIGLKK